MRNSSPSKSLKIATMDGAFFRGRGKKQPVLLIARDIEKLTCAESITLATARGTDSASQCLVNPSMSRAIRRDAESFLLERLNGVSKR